MQSCNCKSWPIQNNPRFQFYKISFTRLFVKTVNDKDRKNCELDYCQQLYCTWKRVVTVISEIYVFLVKIYCFKCKSESKHEYRKHKMTLLKKGWRNYEFNKVYSPFLLLYLSYKIFQLISMSSILYHGTIIRTGITCKKIPCYMRDSACWWSIVKKTKIFWSYVKHFWILEGVRKCRILIGLSK